VILPPGTVIEAKLTQDLSSNSAAAGDPFTAVATAGALPDGTRIDGVIRSASAREGKKPGTLDLSFTRIRLPNGHIYAIKGSLIGLDDKSVTRSHGRLVAKPDHKVKRLSYVGMGAGAAVVAGSLLHSGSLLGNAAIGGGIGYLLGALEKGKVSDVHLKQGAHVGIRLDSTLRFKM
jgi:hypothetical protein